MAVFKYPIVETYVRDWTLRDAIREIVSNAFDAEIEKGAPATVRHLKDTLTVINRGARLDVKALYFGGTSKNDSRLIGQYGEGLKLALLVFARHGVDVRVTNDDERWIVGFEPDDNGVPAFRITTRKVSPTGEVRVDVPGVTDDEWDLASRMFLRLRPPAEAIPTSAGRILLDLDHAGAQYAKGVFVASQPGGSFGYDFNDLNVGRDRKSYRPADAAHQIARMWEEATQRPEATPKIYNALVNGGKEFGMVQYYVTSELVARLVARFRELNGESAYPVGSTGEGVQLEHLGMTPVPMPHDFARILQKGLPTVPQIANERARNVTARYTLGALTTEEAQVLRDVMRVGREIGIELLPDVVEFREPGIEGTYSDGQVRLARKVLASFGKALGVFIHEAAHAAGADAEKSHVDQIHAYMEAAFDVLRQRAG